MSGPIVPQLELFSPVTSCVADKENINGGETVLNAGVDWIVEEKEQEKLRENVGWINGKRINLYFQAPGFSTKA